MIENEKGVFHRNKRKIYVIVLGLFLILFLVLFFGTPKFTFFAIREYEDEEILVPSVASGDEIEYLGYKYSNNSGIIISAESYVSCRWKKSSEDDGWKICEVVFEVEDRTKIKRILDSPNVSLDFRNDNLRNVEISYSAEFEVVDEEYYNAKIENLEIERNKSVVAEDGKKGFESFGKDSVRSESKKAKKKITKTVVKPDEINIRRRRFRGFDSFINNAENTSEFVVNLSDKNIADIYVQGGSVVEEIEEMGEEKEVETNVSEDVDEIVDINGTLGVNESEIKKDKKDKEEEKQNAEEDVRDGLRNESESIESEDTDLVEESFGEESEMNEDEEERIVLEVSLDKDDGESDEVSRGSLSGFAIKYFEEDFSLNTAKPFAVKVSFEIPKYDSNSFNFRFSDKGFEGFIDPDISGCGTLDSANSVYVLTQDVSSSGTCFSITADNITLDCSDYSINYSSSSTGYGIYSNASSTTIKNCVINEVSSSVSNGRGIYFLNSSNGLIENNTLVTLGSQGHGVYLASGSDSNILINNDISASNSQAYGVFVDSSSYSNISRNNITASGYYGYGIYTSGSSFDVIMNNNISTFGEGGSGINVDSGVSSNFSDNEIVTRGVSAYGVFLAEKTNSVVNDNIVSTFEEDGVAIFLFLNADSNIIVNNTIAVLEVDASGFDIYDSDYSVVEGNNISVSGDGGYGVLLDSSSYSNLTKNVIVTQGGSGVGIYLDSGSDFNYFFNNSINTYGSYGYGVYASSSSTGNAFSGIDMKTSNIDAHAIYVYGANSDFNIEDSILNASGSGVDLFINNLASNCEWNFTNVSFFDKTWSAGADSNLIVLWYLDVFANYSNGSIAGGVNVSVYDRNGELKYSGLTNPSGRISRQSFAEYSQNSSSIIYYSNYSVNASVGGEELVEPMNMTGNRDLVFMFNASFGSGEDEIEEEELVRGSGGGGSNCGLSWVCSKWSECIEEVQIRVCDNPDVGCKLNKPDTERRCKVKEVKSKKRDVLFDINLEILERRISSSDKLLSLISLINLGIPGEVDANLSCYIRDSSGKIVYEETEIVPVRTQVEFIKEINISRFLKGKYNLLIGLEYLGQKEPAQAEDSFEIISEEDKKKVSRRFLIGFILIIVFIFIIKFIKKWIQRNFRIGLSINIDKLKGNKKGYRKLFKLFKK